MAKIQMEIDVEDAVEEQLDKQERKITRLEKRITELTARNTELEDIFKSMNKARAALIEATDMIEPYRYDDD